VLEAQLFPRNGVPAWRELVYELKRPGVNLMVLKNIARCVRTGTTTEQPQIVCFADATVLISLRQIVGKDRLEPNQDLPW
jgi:hypothetical protein